MPSAALQDRLAGATVWQGAEGRLTLVDTGASSSGTRRYYDPGWWGEKVVLPMLEPHVQFLRYRAQTVMFVELARTSIESIESTGDLLRSVVQHFGPPLEDEIGADVWAGAQKEISTNCERARDEQAEGFPLLHSLALVGLWGAFESWVEDVALSWLRAKPKLDMKKLRAAVKDPTVPVPISDALEGTFDGARILLDHLLDANRRAKGVSVAQGILRPIGLGVRVSPTDTTSIMEAQQVRHVWAHCAGVADSALCASVPNAGFVLGTRADVSADALKRYETAIRGYMFRVLTKESQLLPEHFPPAENAREGHRPPSESVSRTSKGRFHC